jgi:hypothetical protein
MPEKERPFFAELGAYFDQIGTLAQLDAALLKAEFGENARRLGVALAALAFAAAAGFCALALALCAALLFMVEAGLRPALAALILTLFMLAMACIGALVAFLKLRTWSLKPERTLAQVKQNLAALKASLNDDVETRP